MEKDPAISSFAFEVGAMAAQHQPSNAFSFLSKGWREVRDSADADLRLMKDHANSFKNLATSLDRELENFFNSAALAFSVPAMRSPPPAEIEFVKQLLPKLSEFRRAYSSPDFSKKVLEKWRPRAKIRIDLSAIKNAIVSVSEEAAEDEIVDFERGRRGSFWEEWKGEGETRDWEPIRALKTKIKEHEKRSSSVEIFDGFKNSEFLEKLKSSLALIALKKVLNCLNMVVRENPSFVHLDFPMNYIAQQLLKLK